MSTVVTRTIGRVSETSTPTLLADRYRLITRLAVGGTSTVHLAEDTMLGRTVAIKILHPHLAEDPTFLDRFRREALAAASLSHPHVVTLFDVAAEGTYLVMEHVDGVSLRDVLRLRGRLRPEEVLALLGPAAAGLSAAHAKGLVHRDVKPENVLLGDDGRVKIGDFGLARAAATATSTFGPEMFAGSPHYASPEAVRGEPLDARSDVYGLGVVLYECLTGHPPFQADTPFATAMRHTAGRVPPPSDSTPGVPRELDAVVARATAPDPDDRYPDAAAFAEALAAAVPDGPVAVDLRDGSRDTVILPVDATATVVTAREKIPTRRRRRWWPVFLILGLLLLGGGGWFAYDQVLAPYTDVPAGLVGADPEEASAGLEAAGFTAVVADEPQHSLEVPAGRVLTVDPDDRARRGATVVLTLSAGPRQIEVPPVDGKEEAEATAAVAAADLNPVVVQEHSEEVPAGRVIRTEPAAGTVVDESSDVRVVMSIGRQPIEVPSLVGMSEGDARRTLEDLALQAEVVGSAHHEEIPEGAVISQSVEAGNRLYRGDVIELTISLGPEPFPMPDVEGATESDARATLEGRGLIVQVEYFDALFGFGRGRVGEQRPAPGTEVRRGDTVVLAVLR